MSNGNNVYLSIGSNLGDRKERLATSIKEIGKEVGKITQVSQIYESEPWGVKDQPFYLNQALEIKTPLDPQ